jgi:predicted nucleotidyltransferase
MAKPLDKAEASRLDLSPIQRLLALIEERCRPVAVWLFGSRAKGTSGPESDWDLLVVLPDSVPFEQQDEVVEAIQLRSLSQVNADILSCGESDFKTAKRIPNTLAYEIARTGFPVHEY